MSIYPPRLVSCLWCQASGDSFPSHFKFPFIVLALVSLDSVTSFPCFQQSPAEEEGVTGAGNNKYKWFPDFQMRWLLLAAPVQTNLGLGWGGSVKLQTVGWQQETRCLAPVAPMAPVNGTRPDKEPWYCHHLHCTGGAGDHPLNKECWDVLATTTTTVVQIF